MSGSNAPPSAPVVPRLRLPPGLDPAVSAAIGRWADDIARTLEVEIGRVLASYLPTAQGAMQGSLTLKGDPEGPLEAVPRQYVDAGFAAISDGVAAVDAAKVDRIGDTMTGDLTLAGAARALLFEHTAPANRSIAARVNGLDRWRLFVATGAAESGGNAGSNWQLNRYDDAGVSLGINWTITRGTGEWGIGGNPQAGTALIVRTPAAAISETGVVIQNSNAGNDTAVDLRFQTATGANRARLRGQREGSANTGKLVISTFAAAGVEQEAIEVASTKLTTFKHDSVVVDTAKTPASAAAAGVTGQICWDANYVYVCVAGSTWKRAALATW